MTTRAKIALLKREISRLRKRVQRAERDYTELQAAYEKGGSGRPSQKRVEIARGVWRDLRDRLERRRSRLVDLRAELDGAGTGMMDGKPVARWILRILEDARAAGVSFTVTSGYRSDADQWRVCNTPPYPRPCAPNVPNTPTGRSTSRHRGLVFPDGAVDLAGDRAGFEAYCRANNEPLYNAGTRDPPHFSTGSQFGLGGY